MVATLGGAASGEAAEISPLADFLPPTAAEQPIGGDVPGVYEAVIPEATSKPVSPEERLADARPEGVTKPVQSPEITELDSAPPYSELVTTPIELPEGMVMVETSPERAPIATAIPPEAESEKPRPPRPAPTQLPEEPLVQIETRK